MGKGNAIPTWQFKHSHYMWGQNVMLALWSQSTIYIGNGNALHAWQFKHAHYMWGQNAIPTLWL